MNVFKNGGSYERHTRYALVLLALIVFSLIIVLALNPPGARLPMAAEPPKVRSSSIDGDGRKHLIQDPRSGCVWLSTQESVYKLRGGAECEVRRP
ncbi:hypothetical protein CcrBL47_gp440 [Caulobacter phage BL47]|nr:hypothetical protein CcrBL47_gp440 [Caulobacter phage BL47]